MKPKKTQIQKKEQIQETPTVLGAKSQQDITLQQSSQPKEINYPVPLEYQPFRNQPQQVKQQSPTTSKLKQPSKQQYTQSSPKISNKTIPKQAKENIQIQKNKQKKEVVTRPQTKQIKQNQTAIYSIPVHSTPQQSPVRKPQFQQLKRKKSQEFTTQDVPQTSQLHKDQCDCVNCGGCLLDNEDLKYSQFRKFERSKRRKKQYVPYYEELIRVDKIQRIAFDFDSSSDSDVEPKPIITRKVVQHPEIIRLQPQKVILGENIFQQAAPIVIHHYHPGPYKAKDQPQPNEQSPVQPQVPPKAPEPVQPKKSSLSPDIHKDREADVPLDPLNKVQAEKVFPIVKEKEYMKPEHNPPHYFNPAQRKRYETPPVFHPQKRKKPKEPIPLQPPDKPVYRQFVNFEGPGRSKPTVEPKIPVIESEAKQIFGARLPRGAIGKGKSSSEGSLYVCECQSDCDC